MSNLEVENKRTGRRLRGCAYAMARKFNYVFLSHVGQTRNFGFGQHSIATTVPAAVLPSLYTALSKLIRQAHRTTCIVNAL